MAYEDRKSSEIREGKGIGYASKDECIERALDSDKYGDRTDAYAQGDGYLGMDDIDRIRRKNLQHKIR